VAGTDKHERPETSGLTQPVLCLNACYGVWSV